MVKNRAPASRQCKKKSRRIMTDKLTSAPEKVQILDIPLYAVDIDTATQLLLKLCSEDKRKNLCISATGAHGLVFAKQNKEFENVLKNFYLNLPDGMPGVWVGKLKGARKMKRCYGPDFFENVMIKSSKHASIKHFFCGGNAGVADELKEAVREKFGNTSVVGTYCPPFLGVNEYDYSAIAESINTSGANVLWIGLSTPKQELFASRLATKTNIDFIITVGAAFDFHTNRVPQAPRVLQKISLEWLFRLVMEPKRLFKRYVEIVPLFIYYNFKELVIFASQKLKKQ